MNFKKINNQIKVLKWHFFGWGILVAYESWILFLKGGITDPIGKIILFYFINICLFYSFFFLLKRFEGKRAAIPIISFLVVLLLLLYDSTVFIASKVEFFPLIQLGGNVNMQIIGLYTARGIYFLILSFGTWRAYSAYLSQKENARLTNEFIQMEIEKLELSNQKLQLQREANRNEIRYLKAQINPHFIFNTLNYLYNGIEENDHDRAEALLLLSDILRYNLTDVPVSGKVPLDKEIKNMEALVRLAKLRYDRNCYINIDVKGETIGNHIIPMVLGTLMENIFKHGDITDPVNPALVSIVVEYGYLLSQTKNKIKRSVVRDDHPHTGLNFAKKRLENVYGDDFFFDYVEHNGKFETKLKIPIK